MYTDMEMWRDIRRFIGEVLLIVPDILATRDSAWISSTFSVIKHV